MAKNHRNNTDFQIAHFLMGSCHTPDGAYAMLCDLLEDREAALNHSKCRSLRDKAKRVRAERMMLSDDESVVIEAQADILELDLSAELSAKLVAACEDERAFILRCMKALEPHRKFSHLTLPEAHAESQRDEWLFELIHRAENYLLTSGTIPADHYATMQQHPDFITNIIPAIARVKEFITEPDPQKREQNGQYVSVKKLDVEQLLLEFKP